ncbi:hypothetical protein EC973_002804 [Apophysomyces ossiformis]|uniref:Protein kinase domain-containing protein n=1 Tax=Apophysomyces ossiformis TaxID=679940 RepID=A0A8H7EV20_9FUNG|nr:hypothetical protein EC973_002804 [Apophysomyces ossiformis]
MTNPVTSEDPSVIVDSSTCATRRRPRPPSVVVETLGAKTSETKDGLRKINNYLLKKEIGRGAFGTVHLGLDMITNTEYAIKEFSKSRLRRKEQLDMLRRAGPRGRGGGRGGRGGGPLGGLGVNRPSSATSVSTNPLDLVRGEMAILKKLNHSHVVKLYEVLDDPNDDSLYMVFEMAHKGVLMNIEMDHVAEPYSNDQARYYFREMILGIEYYIKPDNLLLSKDNVLKIVDFGVSEMFVKGNDKLKKSAGSPAFMAPELCVAHHGEVSGKAADIWSMGITLYCLVYGQPPFTSTNLVELYEMIKSNPVPYPKDLDPDLLDLLAKLLEKDPEKRITMPELRVHPWVTRHGEDPLISEEENCEMVVTEITEEEINNAIKSIASIFTVMKAVTKFRRHSRSLSQQSLHKMMEEVKKQDEENNGVDRLQKATDALDIRSPTY